MPLYQHCLRNSSRIIGMKMWVRIPPGVLFQTEKIINSNIDFSKEGWVKKVSKIIGISENKGSKWMKRNMTEFYVNYCWKRKSPKKVLQFNGQNKNLRNFRYEFDSHRDYFLYRLSYIKYIKERKYKMNKIEEIF